MPVNVSFALTTQQILDETKTVTRRSGKRKYKPGQLIQAVNKAMGFKKGEHPVKLKLLEVTNVSYEPLNDITVTELKFEGFPDMTKQQFIDMYCKANKVKPDSIVQRIEFRYVKEEKQMALDSKPTEIKASQWSQVAADVGAGRCVVTNPLYSHKISHIEPIKPNSAGWDVAITDTKSTYRTWSDTKLTVTWLPDAPTADAGEGVVHKVNIEMALLHNEQYGEGYQAALDKSQAEVADRHAFLAEQFDYERIPQSPGYPRRIVTDLDNGPVYAMKPQAAASAVPPVEVFDDRLLEVATRARLGMSSKKSCVLRFAV